MKWLPWIVFAIFGFYLVGNNFQAKLGMIDDHEIAMFLGSDGKVSVDEIPKEIMRTEVGQWGTYLRYRPSYYTLRVLETSLWKDNARLWFVSRYLMLVVSMVIAFKIMSLYFPQIVSYMFLFYAMTMPFWPDMLTRLGPSEMYALPAVLIFVYGMIKSNLWMMSFGYIVAVGSKENLLILFPILLVLFIAKAIKKSLSRYDWFATAIMTVFTFFVVGAIVVATMKAGTDVYGAQISYRYRITKFIWDIPSIIKSRHLYPALAVFGIGIVVGFRKLKSNSILKYLGLMLVILVVIASQYIFYINQLPSNTRYDFPALLLFPVLDLIAVKLLLHLLSKHRLHQVIRYVTYVGLCLVFTIYIFRRGFTLIHNQSVRVVAHTTYFNVNLDKVSVAVKDDPLASLIFVSNRPIDFEPIVSVSRYLDSRSIKNNISLSYDIVRDPNDPMELHDRLENVENGELGSDHIFDRFSKFNLSDTPCYSITFGESLPLPECPEIARF